MSQNANEPNSVSNSFVVRLPSFVLCPPSSAVRPFAFAQGFVSAQPNGKPSSSVLRPPSSVLLALLACLALLTACSPARVVIQWTTATEINTAGFNVYRAERAEGPYTKINAQLIPASDALTGGKYQYEDTTVVAGKTYYYQLEDVEYGGATARHGPIVITASGGWGTTEWLVSISIGALALAVLVWRRFGASTQRISNE